MSILKLKPGYKDYIWGGHRLVDDYNKDFDGDVLAESWELSCYEDCPCIVDSGEYKSKTLASYIEKNGFIETLGTNCKRFKDFPILTKFIDAKRALSIQVHPDEEYASRVEHQHGKTEMWYVVDAEPGAFLYYGFQHEISRDEFEERIKNNTLEEVLHKAEVHKGDTFFIEAGTLHAIGAGILIAEIQQNSNVTYRIYDYGRLGKDGHPRELHIDKALDVTSRTPVKYINKSYPHIGSCEYFTVDHVALDGKVVNKIEGTVSSESFLHFLVVKGSGTIRNASDSVSFRAGDSIFLPAGSGDYSICGNSELLLTYEV